MFGACCGGTQPTNQLIELTREEQGPELEHRDGMQHNEPLSPDGRAPVKILSFPVLLGGNAVLRDYIVYRRISALNDYLFRVLYTNCAREADLEQWLGPAIQSDGD